MQKICGVYKITNKINGKVYIGSSVDLKRRKTRHFSELRKNKHHNNHLQRAYNKYSEESFLFEVLEICDKNNLQETEARIIKNHNSLDVKYGYNISESTFNPSVSGEKHYLYQQYGKSNPMSKAVLQLDENYNIIARYESANLCMRIAGYDASTISKVCRGEKHTFKGFIWKYEEDFKQIDISKIKKTKPFKTKVIKLSLLGVFIKQYDSINEAGRENNINYKNIQTVCKGKRNLAGGYKWAYADEYIKQAL